MNRRTFLLGAAALPACTGDRRPRLNVFNWSEYVAPDTIRNFEHESGARVRYGVYESAEEMLAKVMTGNSGWDIVFPPSNYIEPMREMDLLAPLDHRRLAGLANLDTPFDSPPWDPALTHSVPYMWGATGIVYQTSLSPLPLAWADLWDARLAGRITMLDDPVDYFAACLKKLGLSLNATRPEELTRAKTEALRQKPLLRAYVNQEVRDQLLAGEVLASQCWRDLAARLKQAAPGKLEFAYPVEGFSLYADNAVILRESRRQELAHRFLDYLLRPEVAAGVVESIRTSTVNRAARERLPAEIRESDLHYPPAEVLARGEWLKPLPLDAQRLRDRLWTEIKST